MSESDILKNNPAEPVPDILTAAEGGQPEEPDEESQQGTSENRENLPETIQGKRKVSFLEERKSSRLEEKNDLDTESLQEITKALQFYEPTKETIISFPETLNNEEPVTKKFLDKFTQTFFKYMKNLSNRRFMEIIRQEVDHSDVSLIFYCSESTLQFTFQP